MSRDLIAIDDLRVDYRTGGSLFRAGRPVTAVDGVSLKIRKGETLGLVGESGCGKSSLGKAILRLTNASGGRIVFDGTDISSLSGKRLREQRRRMQMIFQDPYSSLNPRMTAGQIIAEPARVLNQESARSSRLKADELMETVGLSGELSLRLPHEFSGGQRQRIAIARALAAEPEFIVADEPISALDVSIQAQVMNLLQRLQAERGITYLFISHDLRAVRHLSDRVAVMYLGQIVELASGRDLYENALMPYTQALISAVPAADPETERKRSRIVLRGEIPSPADPPSGCRFNTRCPYAIDDCTRTVPQLVEIRSGHSAACIRISPERPYIDKAIGVGPSAAVHDRAERRA